MKVHCYLASDLIAKINSCYCNHNRFSSQTVQRLRTFTVRAYMRADRNCSKIVFFYQQHVTNLTVVLANIKCNAPSTGLAMHRKKDQARHWPGLWRADWRRPANSSTSVRPWRAVAPSTRRSPPARSGTAAARTPSRMRPEPAPPSWCWRHRFLCGPRSWRQSVRPCLLKKYLCV